MKNIFVKGTSVNLVSENGPYVILIHGLGLNKDMWEWQIRDLSKNYSLITYDLIGHGESKAVSYTHLTLPTTPYV